MPGKEKGTKKKTQSTFMASQHHMGAEVLIDFLNLRVDDDGLINFNHLKDLCEAFTFSGHYYRSEGDNKLKARAKEFFSKVPGLEGKTRKDESKEVECELRIALAEVEAEETTLIKLRKSGDFKLRYELAVHYGLLGNWDEQLTALENHFENSKRNYHLLFLKKLNNILVKPGAGNTSNSLNTEVMSGLMSLKDGVFESYSKGNESDLKKDYNYSHKNVFPLIVERIKEELSRRQNEYDASKEQWTNLKNSRKQNYENILEKVLVYTNKDEAKTQAMGNLSQTVLYFDHTDEHSPLVWFDFLGKAHPLELTPYLQWLVHLDTKEQAAGSLQSTLKLETMIKRELWEQAEQYRQNSKTLIHPTINEQVGLKNAYVLKMSSGDWVLHHYDKNGNIDHISLEKIEGLSLLLKDIPENRNKFKPEENEHHKKLQEKVSSLIRQDALRVAPEISRFAQAKQVLNHMYQKRIEKDSSDVLREVKFQFVVNDPSLACSSTSASPVEIAQDDYRECFVLELDKMASGKHQLNQLLWYDEEGKKQIIPSSDTLDEISQIISDQQSFDENDQSMRNHLQDKLLNINTNKKINQKPGMEEFSEQLNALLSRHYQSQMGLFSNSQARNQVNVEFSTKDSRIKKKYKTFLIELSPTSASVYWYNSCGERREIPDEDAAEVLDWINDRRVDKTELETDAAALEKTIEVLVNKENLSSLNGLLSAINLMKKPDQKRTVAIPDSVKDFFALPR